MDYKEKYLRWLEEMWELHNGITREEKRKEEVRKVFEGLCEVAVRRVEVPRSPP